MSELGLEVELEGEVLRGSAEILPEMHVPRTGCLRTSILATWADVLTGVLIIDGFQGRVPTTLDLAIDLTQPARDLTRVDARTEIVKTGRSMAVAEVTFTDHVTANVIALATACFTPIPDVSLDIPPRSENIATLARTRGRLSQPFAERVGCERHGAGQARLPRREDGLNRSNTINGGLLALVAEEAALSLTPGATLSSLSLRYVRAARIGPAVATAVRNGDSIRIEVRDAGAEDRLTVLGMARTFPSHP